MDLSLKSKFPTWQETKFADGICRGEKPRKTSFPAYKCPSFFCGWGGHSFALLPLQKERKKVALEKFLPAVGNNLESSGKRILHSDFSTLLLGGKCFDSFAVFPPPTSTSLQTLSRASTGFSRDPGKFSGTSFWRNKKKLLLRFNSGRAENYAFCYGREVISWMCVSAEKSTKCGYTWRFSQVTAPMFRTPAKIYLKNGHACISRKRKNTQ